MQAPISYMQIIKVDKEELLFTVCELPQKIQSNLDQSISDCDDKRKKINFQKQNHYTKAKVCNDKALGKKEHKKNKNQADPKVQ